MIVKAAIIGGIIGAIAGIFVGGLIPMTVFGAVVGISIRRWVLRTFWQ
ncbi:MAG: hypothetical protein JJT76_03085 [Clostridiaceae bacterium]|nr:hypothetical protein [Clostridiaceae bacterium]